MLSEAVGAAHRRPAWRFPNVMLDLNTQTSPASKAGLFLGSLECIVLTMRNVSFQALLCAVALVACTTDTSIYEASRGVFPADYKQRVKAAIESTWPAPRDFRVLAISTPNDGYLLRKGTFHAVFGAWIGCV